MSTSTPNGTLSQAGPRKLKILMLHGYTQSGPLFHAKTRALEKALQKAFPSRPTNVAATNKAQKTLPQSTLPSFPGGIQLIYPSGPRKLLPADIPGFSSTSSVPQQYNYKPSPSRSGTSTPSSMISDIEADKETDALGWWQRSDTTGEYIGIEDFFTTIASTILEHGGIDGVIGFSQGAAAAAMVASLLEPGRLEAFRAAELSGGISYPKEFRSLTTDSKSETRDKIQGPLRFFTSYSGFRPPQSWANGAYDAFYSPPISIPSLHYIGSLDSVVEESRCLALANACEETKRRVVYHPGGHFVPISKEWVGVLVGFIREVCGEEVGKKEIGNGDEKEKQGVELGHDEFPF